MLHNDKADFNQYHYLFLSNPISMRSFGILAMYQTILNAEIKFIEQCKTPRTEPSLTGKLTANIDYSASKVQDKYEKHLCLDETFINLSEIELQVQNREKVTGADFALLLEWKNDSGKLKICPIYFQAKRVAGEFCDISQYNQCAGYQFHILKAKKINSVYIFYNCDTQNATTSPRVASVKSVKDILASSEPKRTSTVDNVLSLSTYLLGIMVNTNNYKTFNNRFLALNSILESIKEDELASIFSLSVDDDAKMQYQQAYSKYIAYNSENKNENNRDSSFEP